MKNPLVLLLLAATIITTAATDEPSVSGRYQLLAGQFTFIGASGAIPENSVFKLDTQTGRVWVYSNTRSSDGKITEAFFEVRNVDLAPKTDNQLARAEAVIHWCEQHPDGGQMAGIIMDADTVKRTQHNAELDRDRIVAESKRIGR